MQKDIVHSRVVSTLLIVLCIILSAGLSGYFLDLYNTGAEPVNEGPIADAGDTIIFGYRGAPITFNGNASYDVDGNIISYIWDFGDGFTGIGMRPTHTYTLGGNYTVTLTVTDNEGAKNSTSITARISDDDSGAALYKKVTVNDILQNGTSLLGTLVMLEEVGVSDAGSFSSGYGSDPTGWVKFYVKDTSTSSAIDIYCDGGATRPTELSNGDIVTVTGIVEFYNNVWEIKVRKDSTDKVTLVSGGGGGGTEYTIATVNQILSNLATYNNTNVCILGALVTDFYVGSSWIKVTVKDNSTSATIVAFGFDGANITTASAGDYVDVYGHLEWYQPATGDGYPEIMVREDTDDRISLAAAGGGGTGSYTQATVNQLITSMATYNNTDVCVLGALVTDYYVGSSWIKVTVTDNSTPNTIVAFGFDGADIATASIGDYVDVYGRLEWYQPATGDGYPEIMIREDTDDRISLAAAGGGGGGTGNYTQATVNQLLTSTATYNNTDVCILGALVTDYYVGSSWIKVTVTDNSTSGTIVAFGFDGANITTASAGDYVDVYGHLEWYQPATGDGYLEIMIREDTDDRISLAAAGGGGSGNYTVATVNQLLTSTATYNNTDVSVLGALVMDYYDGTSWTKVTVTDNSTSGTIVIFGFDGADIVVVAIGDYVDVYGHLEWYQPATGNGYLEIAIREDTDDRMILASVGGGGGTGDYTAYTINTLLTNSAAHENELVAVLNAEIVDLYAPSYTKITVTDTSTTAELIVFCSSGSNVDTIAIGDIVDIYGTFIYYAGGSYWEITVEADTDDRVEYVSSGGGGGGGDYTEYDIDTLLSNPSPHEGELVAILGAEIVDLYAPSYTKITVTDDSTTEELIIFCSSGSNVDTIAIGDIVDIYGTFIYYAGGSYWEITVEADTDDRVEYVSSGGGGGGGDYTVYTVAQLISQGLALEDDLVCALNVTISGVTYGSYLTFEITDSTTSEVYPVYCQVGSTYPTGLVDGDIVSVYGIVADYYGAELKVMDGDDRVVFVSSGGGGGGGGEYTLATINDLLTDSSTYEDENIYVLSAQVTDSSSFWKGFGGVASNWVSFKVTDNSTSSTIMVYCEANADRPLELTNGTWLDISGTLFWYDGTTDYWEIKVRADTQDNVSLASGGGVEPPVQGYTEVTVQELLTNSAQYLDKNISVVDAIVSDAFTYNMGTPLPFNWVVFYITDGSTASSIKVYCEPFSTRPGKLSNGNEVNLMGVLGEQYGVLEIVIRNNDDDFVKQMSNGYEVLSVRQLIENDYSGTEACLLGAVVTDAYSYNSGYGDLPGDPVMFFVSDYSTSQSLLVSCQPFANRPLELSDDYYVNVYGIIDEHYGTTELLVRASTNDTVTVSGASGKIVYYVTDHGADMGEFNNFANSVNTAGFAYMEGLLANANLSLVKLLVISNPDTLFDAGQLATINAYVTGGGSLLLLCEADVAEEGKPENLNPILANLGVQGRFNDDRFEDMLNCYDMWSYSDYNVAIPYFNYYDTSNGSAYNAGCFDLDSTNMTDDVFWVRGSSVSTLYNTSNDVTVIRGSDWGYNVDSDAGNNEAYFHSYATGTYPPILAANDSVGLGKVIYGGLAHTFSDANAVGWSDSNITNLIVGMLEWAAEDANGSSVPAPIIRNIEPIDLLLYAPEPILPITNLAGTRTMIAVTIPGRNEY